ncbi:hypothetical protein MKW94_020385 [Papaver nudicaule]|uniref:Uncharacterized protein n=1 Tax=Papaver nudicaule TaxID=74823 RepID=A0AA41VWX3_PAPNU|nr:hypothetical protein [Papaver nudicaule]
MFISYDTCITDVYCMKNRIDDKSFKADIERYSSIYVFIVIYAKLESPVYQRFIQSDLTADGFSKVYIGASNRLGCIVGTAPRAELRPGESGYKTHELRPGLHKIGGMLDMYDYEVGALLTDRTEDEVLAKFAEYRESDYAGEVVPLPSARSSAMKLCPKLKELGMPVELCGRAIKLTEKFVVCEDGVRVTENAAKILKHLEIKMFDFVLVPMGYWSASTGETKYYPWMDQVPKCR